MKKVMSCSETWEVGKGTRRGPWGCFLRKPELLLLQLPVLAENKLWSLLTQVVGSRNLPSPSLADSYPSQSDSLLTPFPSGSPAVCSSMTLVSLARWVRPGHPSGRGRKRDSPTSPGLAAVVSSPPPPILRDQAWWKERVAHSPSQTSCFRFSRRARS